MFIILREECGGEGVRGGGDRCIVGSRDRWRWIAKYKKTPLAIAKGVEIQYVVYQPCVGAAGADEASAAASGAGSATGAGVPGTQPAGSTRTPFLSNVQGTLSRGALTFASILPLLASK